MPDLEFDPHARDQLAERRIPEEADYHVVGDYDEMIERDDRRTEYTGTWEGREILVVTEREEEPLLVITVIERKRRRPRRR